MFLMVPPASPALRPFVEGLWYVETPPPYGPELVLPSGTTQLIVNLHQDVLASAPQGKGGRRVGGAAFQGTSALPAVIDTVHQRATLGVAFRPGGAHPFFGEPAWSTRDDLLDLGDLWGRDGATLRERLLEAPTPLAMLRELEALLLARADRPLAPDRAVTWAVEALDRGAAVAAIADRIGMTRKRLATRFAEVIGVPPKRFGRLRRFQRLLEAAGGRQDVDWARLAAECRYYDQPHLIREFHAFAGMTPTAYRPRSTDARNHVPLVD